MSKLQQTVAKFICGGTPCPYHLSQADLLLKKIEEVKKEEREAEAQAALDRLVEGLKDATHAV